MEEKNMPLQDTRTRSEELFNLYEQFSDMGESIEEEQAIDLRTGKSLEAIYGASQWTLMWRKFIRNKAAIAGGIVILLFYLGALFADFLAPYTLTTRLRRSLYMPPQTVHFWHDGKFGPFVYGVKLSIDKNLRKTYSEDTSKIYPLRFFAKGEPYKLFGLIPAERHLFLAEEGGVVSLLGTDRQGRDMFSRILKGSQISLSVGLVGVFLSLFFGAILGLVSGFYGGWIDNFIQRVIELVRSFPQIPLWMALSAAVPKSWTMLQTYFAITVILSLIGWTWLARQLRGKVLSLRNEDFVLAAKLAGASDSWIIFRHLVPATLGQIIVVSTLAMPAMILAETALSYLGLGLQAPITSWGVLIQEAQNFQTLALYPWLFIPAVAVAISILAFSYLGDGLRDAVDPYTI
jgi:peptide/nickel transport system permease protein